MDYLYYATGILVFVVVQAVDEHVVVEARAAAERGVRVRRPL